MKKIKIIYGLGNNEAEFKNSRHNLGKEIVDFYIQEPVFLKNSYYAYLDNLILASNLGYMNNCGLGIKEILKKTKLNPENLLVIHDDADLIFPHFKISFASHSAGHKGVESIIKELKTKKFWRFKIGIQNNKKRKKAEEIVLTKWNLEESLILKKIKKSFKIILEKLSQGRMPHELNLSKDYFVQK